MNAIEEIAASLHTFLAEENIIYLTCDPEISDFTQKHEGRLILRGRKSQISFPICYGEHELRTFVGLLMATLFSSDVMLICWDIKRLISHLRFHLGRNYKLDVQAKVRDLRLIEAFLGKEEASPTNWLDAAKRTHLACQNHQVLDIHNRIHLPLALRIVPSMETLGIAEIERKKVYSFYHIEGQKHGRLRCTKAFDNCIVPHAMSGEEKAKLRPGLESHFVVIDYKSMEASVLQWLSHDETLNKIISSGRDVYETTYHLFLGSACDDKEKRTYIKKALLPIFYGMQADKLAFTLSVSKDEANHLIGQVRQYFATAMEYLDEIQAGAERDRYADDLFGRHRTYEEKPWVARNAMVQGVAAIVCQEKLIQLYNLLGDHVGVVMSVHDGYVLIVRFADLKDTIEAAKAILETPSGMCPGLRLKTECKIGNDLCNLTKYKEKSE